MSVGEQVGEWRMIPENAFLYFPQGKQVRQGQGQKQWRKIFQNGQPYEEFQNRSLQNLQQKLSSQRIVPNQWFDVSNKLRFLQANKFKIQQTWSTWRQTYFPIKQNPDAIQKLKQGTLYFCGRDQQFRPILVVQIVKMKKYPQQIIPPILNILLQYALQQLLIPGQVQNYVLIINLDGAGFSDRNAVSKIVSFTSNTYRSRLFASYLLNTPWAISTGWNAFASAVVSENTLRKIKISQGQAHDDMWLHIDRNIVEKKYGGNLPNVGGSFWPPSQQLMNYVSPNLKVKLVTKQQYNKLYREGRLNNRKVKQSLLQSKPISSTNLAVVNNVNPGTNSNFKQQQSNQIQRNTGQNISNNQITPPMTPNNTNTYQQQNPAINSNPNSHFSANSIKIQPYVPIKRRQFELFFKTKQFQAIINKR